MTIGVGVIGYGYWGPNVVRNFQDLEGATVHAICDTNPQRNHAVRHRYPHVRVTADAAQLIADPSVDLVVVTTPISTHYELTRASLEASKHVFVAKPLATSEGEAQELIALAERKQRLLLVDHTFVYTPAVQKIRELVASELGEPYYYDSTRISLGLIQHDVSVLWDLATHDMAILDYLFTQRPISVSARAVTHVGNQETVAYILVTFEGSLVAHINVNWLAPRKVRTVLIGGSKKMIVYDDNEPSEKVKVYDRGVLLKGQIERAPTLVQYRTGDMFSPQVENREALAIECQHALDCIEKGTKPITGGAHALRVVRLLAAAERSLRSGGTDVRL